MASVAEALASTRFIPPSGALQFEVKLMRRPETKPLEGCAVWVEDVRPIGAVMGGRFCSCEKEYKLIPESLPEGSAKEFLFAVLAVGAALTLCPCNGDIIE